MAHSAWPSLFSSWLSVPLLSWAPWKIDAIQRHHPHTEEQRRAICLRYKAF
jgi:hypothetical protein